MAAQKKVMMSSENFLLDLVTVTCMGITEILSHTIFYYSS